MADPSKAAIPVIDLFAGPGGLGEGFSTLDQSKGASLFKIRLSIEKDAIAHQTLELRAFFRQFPHGEAPAEYYQLNDQWSREALYAKYPREAEAAKCEALLHELCSETAEKVREHIDEALGKTDRWVLLGGPPCQAYSLVGRSRNRGMEEYVPEEDKRQTLYVEYLQVIADHAPAVFVMENVKGLLSATLDRLQTLSDN